MTASADKPKGKLAEKSPVKDKPTAKPKLVTKPKPTAKDKLVAKPKPTAKDKPATGLELAAKSSAKDTPPIIKARATVKAHESVNAHERELETLTGGEGPGHMIDYVRHQFDSFSAKPFSAVDSLVLSQIAYWKLENAPLGTLRDLYKAELFGKLFDDTRVPLMNMQLLAAVAASPRFRDIEVIDREKRISKVRVEQFAGCAFRLPDRTIYVGYRGTDNSFLGWKEDFNMAFMSPIPSQTSAKEYLERVATLSRGSLLVGGHSKGGNLAVYAAMMCEPKVRDRIVRVYSHDGPGFEKRVLEGADFAGISERLDKTVPQSSIIGMAFERQERYRIIHSDNHGIMQHDPYSWAIEGDDFMPESEITGSAEYTNVNLADFLQSLDDEHREKFVDGFFRMIDATGCTQVPDFKSLKPSQYAAGIAALVDMEPETRDATIGAFTSLLSIAVKNIPFVAWAQDAAAKLAQGATDGSEASEGGGESGNSDSREVSGSSDASDGRMVASTDTASE